MKDHSSANLKIQTLKSLLRLHPGPFDFSILSDTIFARVIDRLETRRSSRHPLYEWTLTDVSRRLLNVDAK